jgi:hypothetical protein
MKASPRGIYIITAEKTQKLAVGELAQKADGLAIWLNMVLEYVRRPQPIETQKGASFSMRRFQKVWKHYTANDLKLHQTQTAKMEPN